MPARSTADRRGALASVLEGPLNGAAADRPCHSRSGGGRTSMTLDCCPLCSCSVQSIGHVAVTVDRAVDAPRVPCSPVPCPQSCGPRPLFPCPLSSVPWPSSSVPLALVLSPVALVLCSLVPCPQSRGPCPLFPCPLSSVPWPSSSVPLSLVLSPVAL
eukprot:3998926-Pyramimonas_sp.AAC.1